MVIGVIVLILVLLAAGCGASNTSESYRGGPSSQSGKTVVPATTQAPAFTPPQAPSATTSPENSPGSGSPGFINISHQTQGANRMVVRNGNIQLVVNNVSTAIDSISKLTGELGGYIVSSQKWKEGERNMGTISIRVPAETFDQAVAALRGLAVSVISESTTTQDVTEEYVDLQSRVRNLEATEVQLLKVMESTTDTEDILNVQRELTRVQGDIEQAKGRMQYLERTSSMSYIEIKLNEAILDLKFNANKVRVNNNESIRFTSECMGGFAPYNYFWDFGDGETSVEHSPVHSYSRPGIYNISLKVTDDKGYTSSLTRNEYINVVGSWNPGSIAASAWNGFTAFGKVMVNVLIWLGIFSPVWIIIGLILWATVFRKRRKAS